MERDRAKKAKASAKRERRQERVADTDETEPEQPVPVAHEAGRLSEAEVIDRLKVLHDRFEDGAVGFDDFEEQKAALLARLAVD
ncbi:MAG: hypothetical protein ACRD0A_02960 [Acidimicrobiales bacterium]